MGQFVPTRPALNVNGLNRFSGPAVIGVAWNLAASAIRPKVSLVFDERPGFSIIALIRRYRLAAEIGFAKNSETPASRPP